MFYFNPSQKPKIKEKLFARCKLAEGNMFFFPNLNLRGFIKASDNFLRLYCTVNNSS